jgi:hypothetical protein
MPIAVLIAMVVVMLTLPSYASPGLFLIQTFNDPNCLVPNSTQRIPSDFCLMDMKLSHMPGQMCVAFRAYADMTCASKFSLQSVVLDQCTRTFSQEGQLLSAQYLHFDNLTRVFNLYNCTDASCKICTILASVAMNECAPLPLLRVWVMPLNVMPCDATLFQTFHEACVQEISTTWMPEDFCFKQNQNSAAGSMMIHYLGMPQAFLPHPIALNKLRTILPSHS